MFLLRKYISSLISERAAPKDADAGEYLFATGRSDVPDEENTKVEDDTLHALVLHYMHTVPLDPKTGNRLKTWLKNGWYTDLLRPPNGFVYRGLKNVSKDQLTRWLGKEPHGINGKASVSSLYKTRDFASSWTIDKDLSMEFAFRSSREAGDDGYNVILVADTSENDMLMNPGSGGIYNVDQFETFDYEQEVIGLGDIKLVQVMFMKI